MLVHVRINGALAQEIGTTRLQASLEDGMTVSDLLAWLCQQYPQSATKLNQAVPIVAGQHLPQTTVLVAGQEVALLLPVAGG